MIFFSFCFGQVFVSEILNAQAVCFLSIDWVVPIVMFVPINAGEMKTFEKSHLYSRVHVYSKLKEILLLPSSGRNPFIQAHKRTLTFHC